MKVLTNENSQKFKGFAKRQTIQTCKANLANVAHKPNECFYYITIMHIRNMILKRIITSPKHVIMEETCVKESMRLRIINYYLKHKIS